ncbi:MAG TPA: type I phosphomannose isomerase catalytic subunit [Phycisphaerae bacterium]|nr:type I phosphomannose isomerase catalytic subunit [Phycisphaerae bacterium]
MYPLKFQPVFQKRLWGGNRLRTVLGKSAPAEETIGESWELADLPAGTVKADSRGAAADGSLASVITNGAWAGKTVHDVISDLKFESSDSKRGYFPLLIKFLDASQDLSVQVHPDAAYCKAHPGSHLKSEAWYILHAEPGARIYKGVKAGVTREQFKAGLEGGNVEPLLNVIRVRTGDCHFLPSGTVHAMGAGILAAEVQTPSDTTFRVFDWNRLEANGKPRTLHIKEALECISFDAVATPSAIEGSGSPVATRLAACEFFTIDRVELPLGDTQIVAPEMAVWIVLNGQGVITVDGQANTAFAKGDTLLLPAGMENPRVRTIADCAWLEVKALGKC